MKKAASMAYYHENGFVFTLFYVDDRILAHHFIAVKIFLVFAMCFL